MIPIERETIIIIVSTFGSVLYLKIFPMRAVILRRIVQKKNIFQPLFIYFVFNQTPPFSTY